MTTIIEGLNKKPIILTGEKKIINDNGTEIIIEDVPKGPSINFPGVDIIRQQQGKTAVVDFSYPFLNPSPTTELEVRGKTIKVSFT